MFLEHPWAAAGLPSLVYEETSGEIAGFLGVLPRPIIFESQPGFAAVTSQFMVDTKRHRGNAGLELMKRFFAGPQQLSLTDGASEGARRIWEAFRGETATVYSCLWTRVLRPAEYALEIARNRKALKPLSRIGKPFAWALDTAAVRIPHTPYPLPEAATIAKEAESHAILECIAALPPSWSLRPCYKPADFAWLIQKAVEATSRGRLRKAIVHNAKGEMLGWYVYYAKAGGISKVLQIGGKDHAISQVIDHLLWDAWQAGSVAVSGRLEPKLARDLSRKRCDFIFHDVAVLIHSRNNAIRNVIHSGKAFLTRLDGEWWMRFQVESWR